MSTRHAFLSLLLIAIRLATASGQTMQISIPPGVDPDQIINESYNLLRNREPNMTAAEYAIYEKVVPMVSEQPEFALALLEAMQDDDEPSSAAFKLVLGNVYYSQDRFEDARQLYQGAVEEFPEFRRAWENLGILHFRNEAFRLAVTCLTQAVELGGKDPRLMGLLAYCHLRSGNPIAAEVAFMQAHLSDPDSAQWTDALIDLYLQSNQYARAEILARQRLSQKREQPAAWTLYANILRSQQRLPDAIAILELAKALDYASADSLRLLGDLYVEAGDATEASRIYQTAAIRFPTESTQRALDYAIALAHQSQLQHAASILESLEPLPEQPELESQRQYALALLAFYQEDLPSAAAQLESLLAADPLHGPGLLLLGELRERSEEPHLAAFAYEQALADSDSAYAANIHLSRLSIAQDDLPQAIDRLEQALSLKSSPALREHLAKVRNLARNRDDS